MSKKLADVLFEIDSLEAEMSKYSEMMYSFIPELEELDYKIYEQKQLQNKYDFSSPEYIKHLQLQIDLEKQKLELFNEYKNNSSLN